MTDFFDKVKQGIDKGVTVASVRSKEMLDASKIKGRIDKLAGQKKSALAGLGSLIYARKSDFELDGEMKEKCEEITGLEAEIKQKGKELKQVHVEAKKNLGIQVCDCEEELAGDDEFCRKCGKKIAD